MLMLLVIMSLTGLRSSPNCRFARRKASSAQSGNLGRDSRLNTYYATLSK
jgi:hypothetical protein